MYGLVQYLISGPDNTFGCCNKPCIWVGIKRDIRLHWLEYWATVRGLLRVANPKAWKDPRLLALIIPTLPSVLWSHPLLILSPTPFPGTASPAPRCIAATIGSPVHAAAAVALPMCYRRRRRPPSLRRSSVRRLFAARKQRILAFLARPRDFRKELKRRSRPLNHPPLPSLSESPSALGTTRVPPSLAPFCNTHSRMPLETGDSSLRATGTRRYFTTKQEI